MKKDRNCGATATPYPVYNQFQSMPFPMMQGPAVPGIMPGIPNSMPMPIPYMNGMNGMTPMPTTTSSDSQLSDLNNRINNLERRVNNIENTLNDTKMTSYANKYSSSNYQMM